MKQILLLLTLLTLSTTILALEPPSVRLPKKGALVGAYVDSGPMADRVETQVILDFESQIGKKLIWTYFSDNWIDGIIEFPWGNVAACDEAGTIPYIRMNPWTEARTYQKDDYLHMQGILDGHFDLQIQSWAQGAKDYGKPLIIEFGPEVNGDWFPWNGRWNGGGVTSLYGDPLLADGPERYRDAYRKVIDIFRSVGVKNVTWVFHVDTAFSPWRPWNRPEFYYPGNDYIHWIGLSVFGRQLPKNEWLDFRGKLDFFWEQVEDVSHTKPVIIAEFAVIEDASRPNRKAQWLESALQTIKSDPKFSRIRGISYWNSPGFYAETQPEADMRISSSPQALESFVNELKDPFWIGRDQKEEQP